jgi:hypothetical protein
MRGWATTFDVATCVESDAVEPGIHPAVLPDTDLFRELGHLYETRLETLRHGSKQALSAHSEWARTGARVPAPVPAAGD